MKLSRCLLQISCEAKTFARILPKNYTSGKYYSRNKADPRFSFPKCDPSRLFSGIFLKILT